MLKMNHCETLSDEVNCLEPFDDHSDDTKRKSFRTKIEEDLQCIFDDLFTSQNTENSHICVRDSLKKGRLFQRGDYFMSLRSIYFPSMKQKLIAKLNESPYIRESDVDQNGNLILGLNRPVIYKDVLNDVMSCEKRYGMMEIKDTFMIVVHNEDLMDFNALRLALVADHLISFLTANDAKVYVTHHKKYIDLSFKEIPTILCHDNCFREIEVVSESIKTSAKSCKWRVDSVIDDSIILNAKEYCKLYSAVCLGKDLNNFKIVENQPNNRLTQAAKTAHYAICHLDCDQDVFVHICLQSQKQKILESSLLLKMLDIFNPSEICVSCQNVNFKSSVSVEMFLDYQKQEIESSMVHKYGSNILKTDMWENHLKTLLDTVVKFIMLSTGLDSSLRVEYPFDHTKSKRNNGIFIQYNFARLANIFRNFEQKVGQGLYKPLPPLNEIDFGLLRLEEEWSLLGYIISFPCLMKEAFPFNRSSKIIFHANKICIMLTKLCHEFSLYYSKIRILGEPQPHLQRIMHARLWLLKGVQQIMINSFLVLNIQGLNEM